MIHRDDGRDDVHACVGETFYLLACRLVLTDSQQHWHNYYCTCRVPHSP